MILPSKERLKKYNYDDIILCVGAVMLFLVLLLRDLNVYETNKFIIVGIVGLVSLIVDYNHIMQLSALLIPMSCGIPSNYCYMVMFAFYVIKKRSFGLRQMIFPIIFIAMELLIGLFSGKFNFVNEMSYLVCLSFTFFLIFERKDKSLDYEKSQIWFIVGVTFMLVMIFINTVQLIPIEYIISARVRVGYTNIREDGAIRFSTNANTIGFFALISLCLSLNRLKYNKRFRFILAVFTLLNVVIGMLSLSRTYYILTFFILAIFILGMVKMNAKSIAVAFGTVALVVVTFVILYNNTGLFDSYRDRFEDGNINSAGGRVDAIVQYYEWQTKDPMLFIFGAGAESYMEKSGLMISVHNGFQQIFVAYGLLGGFIMTAAIIYGIKYAVNGKRKKFAAHLALIAWLLFVQTVQLLNPVEYFLCFAICLFPLKSDDSTTITEAYKNKIKSAVKNENISEKSR